MNEVISFGPFALSVGERQLRRGETPIQLGSRALDILVALIEHAGEVVSNKDLIASAWPDVTVDGGVLRVHIAGLRKALGDGLGGARYVINIPGRGYSFVAPISRSRGVEIASSIHAPSHHTLTLPPPLKRIVGRDETCRTISEQLKTHRFVNIVGPGGMGKTTVALSVGHAALPDFDGAVTFVDFGSIIDPHLVANTVASTLGLGLQGIDPVAFLIASLANRKLLLLLDNCEHVIEAIAPLAERIFSEAPEAYILATSRESLRVEGEHVYRLEPLESPIEIAGLTAADAMTFPAVQLFVERAAARGSPVKLSDDDAPVVGEMCRNLDGLALAIELAASRVTAHGFRGTAALLDKRFKLEWQGRRTALPRHQTLTSMLDWSYNLLAAAERLVLRRLSVLVGPFDIEAAADIVVEPGGDTLQFEDILAGLVEKSLVSPIIGDANVRYRLLETTRAYAAGKLSEAGETDMVAERHARHYTDLLQCTELSDSLFREPDPLSISAHLGNIRAALNWCFSDRGKPSLGIALAAAAAPFLMRTPLVNECIRWSTRAISALPDADRGSSIELILQDAVARSSVFISQSGASCIRATFERSLALVAKHGDDAFRLRLLASFNVFLIRMGEFQAALGIAHEAQAAARSLNDPAGMVISNWIEGTTQHLAGNQAAAQASCEAGFAQAAAFPNINTSFLGSTHRIRALTALARARWISGFPDQALAAAQRALSEAADDGSKGGISLVYAPAVFMWCGDEHEQKAQELIENLIAYATRYALTALVGAGLGLKGEFLVKTADATMGVALLRRAIEISNEEKNQLQVMPFTTALAAGLAALGQYGAALTAIDRAISLVTGTGGLFYFSEMLRIKGDILAAMPQSDGVEAEAWLLRSLNQARSHGDLSWELRTAMSLAKLMSKQGRLEPGRTLLVDVYGRFSEGFATADLRQARRQLDDMEGLTGLNSTRKGIGDEPLQLFATYNTTRTCD
jgi:predicted ATPase/DNA-binding winged helix-turn-helix (wHTH) protein